MRRTLITNVQWWLFIVVTGITWAIVPHLRDFPWWGLILFGFSYYAAVLLVFRINWETRGQAYERRETARRTRWIRKYLTDLGYGMPPWHRRLINRWERGRR